jgi:formate dehydrogenase major subunit
MSGSAGTMSRRDFFKASAGGGFALGSLFGLGLDLRAAQEETRNAKFVNTREVPSVCPYCAVGCSQLITVSTQTKQIVNIEGNPASPINRGTLCPKGAATFQLAVNPNRITKVWYRAPGATDWDKTKTLDWAMEQIAQRVKAMRDKPGNFVEWTDKDKDGNLLKDKDGKPVKKLVNQLMAIGSLGGATMDNEWNYLQAKLMRALGVVNIENQARI